MPINKRAHWLRKKQKLTRKLRRRLKRRVMPRKQLIIRLMPRKPQLRKLRLKKRKRILKFLWILRQLKLIHLLLLMLPKTLSQLYQFSIVKLSMRKNRDPATWTSTPIQWDQWSKTKSQQLKMLQSRLLKIKMNENKWKRTESLN